MLTPVVRWESASSRSDDDRRAFSTSFERLFSIVARARSSAPAAASTSRTSNPACAKTWAIPLPIVPAPITPIFLRVSIPVIIARSHGERVRSRPSDELALDVADSGAKVIDEFDSHPVGCLFENPDRRARSQRPQWRPFRVRVQKYRGGFGDDA